jgi:hypothetical protein
MWRRAAWYVDAVLVSRPSSTLHNAGICMLSAWRHFHSDLNSFSALSCVLNKCIWLKAWRRQFYIKKLCQPLYIAPSNYVIIQKMKNFGLIAVRFTCPYLWIIPTESGSRNQPLEEINTCGISWGKGGWCVRLTNSSPSCADCLQILGALTSSSANGLYRNSLTFTFTAVSA